MSRLIQIESVEGKTLSSRIARLERDATARIHNGESPAEVAVFIQRAMKNIMRNAGFIVRPIGCGASVVGGFDGADSVQAAC